jgi:hypothetical protein
MMDIFRNFKITDMWPHMTITVLEKFAMGCNQVQFWLGYKPNAVVITQIWYYPNFGHDQHLG